MMRADDQAMTPFDLNGPRVSVLRSRWIAPMDGPLLCDAAVAFSRGRILQVGSATKVISDFSGAVIEDLGDTLLLPGLINSHVHLELSAMSRGQPPASFSSWLLGLIPAAPSDPAALQESVSRGVAIGVAQCQKFGVCTVGDISRQCGITRRLLMNGPLRVVSFGEVQAMAQRRALLEERIAAAVDEQYQTEHLRVAISPHAPYSIEAAGFRQCLEIARRRGLSLATHLAESSSEAEFLAGHRGEFRGLWDALGAWDDAVPRFAGGPIRFAADLGLLDFPALLAHVNYCDDEEMKLLAAGRASVVYCPRTHEFFGHPPHRLRDMLAAGVNVAVGTDSCASSPDLNLVDDLRRVHSQFPGMTPPEIWQLATTRAARALRLEEQIGTLSPGKSADFVAFPVASLDVLREVLEAPRLPSGVWINGARFSQVRSLQ